MRARLWGLTGYLVGFFGTWAFFYGPVVALFLAVTRDLVVSLWLLVITIIWWLIVILIGWRVHEKREKTTQSDR